MEERATTKIKLKLPPWSDDTRFSVRSLSYQLDRFSGGRSTAVIAARVRFPKSKGFT